MLRSISKSGPKILGKIRAKPMEGAPGAVLEERLFRPNGHRGYVLTIDANSPTFTSDLTLMFEKNVARARRRHKRKAESSGRVGQGD